MFMMDRRRHDLETLWKEEPEALSDNELYHTKLAQLSRSLQGASLSSRRVIGTYQRWLEVQRTGAPHNANLMWETVQKQWVVSLKARGFTRHDIGYDAEHWNNQGYSRRGGRAPLTKSMVYDTFDSGFPDKKPNARSHQTEMGSYKESNNPLKRPVSAYDDYKEVRHEEGPHKRVKHTAAPSNYICNRCKCLGHYLSDCPTSFDPTYDTRPPENYRCQGCSKSDHYFTLCPLNANRDSLFQLRKAKKEREQGLADAFRRPPPRTRLRPQTVDRLKFEEEEIFSKDETEADKQGPEFKHSSNTFDFENSLVKATSEAKPDLISSYHLEKRREAEQLSKTGKIESEDDIRSSQYPARSSEIADSFTNISTGHEYHNHLGPSEAASLQGEKRVTSEDKMHTGNMIDSKVQEKEKVSVSSPMELKGASKVILHPRTGLPIKFSTEILNKRPERPTALEMWDRDDAERAEKRRLEGLPPRVKYTLEMDETAKLIAEDVRQKNSDSFGDEAFVDAAKGREKSTPTSPLQPASDSAGGDELDISVLHVLHVTQLEAETPAWQVRDMFKHYDITACSVWKPYNLASTKSAFVSLKLGSGADVAQECCENISGRQLNGINVLVTHINNSDAFEAAKAEFLDSLETNKEFLKHPYFKQYKDQHRMLLQHLRLTTTLDLPLPKREVNRQVLQIRSAAPSPQPPSRSQTPSPQIENAELEENDEDDKSSEVDTVVTET